jgi:NAD(P)H-dependent flavin oxidoreductase YrpB (nitropropane dioxygenase family)
LSAFDEKFGTSIGRRICEQFYVEGGKAPDARFRSAPMQIVHALDGRSHFPLPSDNSTRTLFKLDDEIIELLIATGFAEVWLAKEGHQGRIFINFLNKIELPLVYVLYGAMLAGVDGIVVGAGNPEGLPALCRALAGHEPVAHKISLLYRETGEEALMAFDPEQIAGGKFTTQPLAKPAFLAIVSLEELVKALAESPSLPPDGFIIEHHTAGGHNANPAGPMVKDALGQPIYGIRDEADLAAIRATGLPFWLAGGFGSRDKFQAALVAGANGIQAGTVFAMAEESGMKPEYRSAILTAIKNGAEDADLVHTSTFSPTGFSFKVVQIQDTLSEEDIYANRRRICDIGLLQQRGFNKPDEDGQRTIFQRCPAGPIDAYVKNRGLAHNTDERRCLCNGLLSCVGLGQVKEIHGEVVEEPAIVTLGNHLDGVRRLSRQGQTRYHVQDVVDDILGSIR